MRFKLIWLGFDYENYIKNHCLKRKKKSLLSKLNSGRKDHQLLLPGGWQGVCHGDHCLHISGSLDNHNIGNRRQASPQ